MRQLVQAIQNRDGSALAAMSPTEKPKQQVPQQAIQIFNELFRQLKAAFPALTATIKEQSDLNELRRQWVLAFAENGINSMEQVNAGMKIARQQATPFLPSPGQFVAWCKQGELHAAGLPDEDTLYSLVMTYCAKRDDYASAEDYPWGSNAEYWMVTGLRSMMRANNLSESELRVKCRSELRKMSQRVEAGEEIPEPRKQLLKLSIPSTTEKALEGVALLRATMKRGKS